jgi:hypothetical protein
MIRWGSAEAEAAYFQFSQEIDALQDVDKRKFFLFVLANPINKHVHVFCQSAETAAT